MKKSIYGLVAKGVITAFIAFSQVALSGCGGDILDMSCDNEKSDVRSSRGMPTRTTNYESTSGYTSETWWYGSTAITFTYTGGKCEVSTYRG